MLNRINAVAAIGAAAAAQPALAQDAPTTFDGVYVSGAVGLENVDSGAKGLQFDTNRNGVFGDTVRTTTAADAFSPGFCTGNAIGNNAGAGCTGDDDGIGYALRIGVDKRSGPFVAGLLLEGSKSNATDFETGFSSTPASYTFAREINYALALRGRLGISPGDGRGLLYVTGGLAYADIDRAFTTTNGANSFALVEDGEKKLFGAQLGGGGEIVLGSNFTLGLEYLYSRYEDDGAYVDVGRGTAPLTNPFLLNGGGTFLQPADTHLDQHSFRVTAGFQF